MGEPTTLLTHFGQSKYGMLFSHRNMSPRRHSYPAFRCKKSPDCLSAYKHTMHWSLHVQCHHKFIQVPVAVFYKRQVQTSWILRTSPARHSAGKCLPLRLLPYSWMYHMTGKAAGHDSHVNDHHWSCHPPVVIFGLKRRHWLIGEKKKEGTNKRKKTDEEKKDQRGKRSINEDAETAERKCRKH